MTRRQLALVAALVAIFSAKAILIFWQYRRGGGAEAVRRRWAQARVERPAQFWFAIVALAFMLMCVFGMLAIMFSPTMRAMLK
jgi:hypothetical protein